jgi:hypothetical protein
MEPFKVQIEPAKSQYGGPWGTGSRNLSDMEGMMGIWEVTVQEEVMFLLPRCRPACFWYPITCCLEICRTFCIRPASPLPRRSPSTDP